MGGVVDMITGKPQRDAANAANKAAGNQKEVINRIVKLFDTQLGKVQGAESGGLWDPDRQIALANEDLMRKQDLERQASAGTAKTLGYRRGDSVPITQDRRITQDYDLRMRLQNFGIRQQSMQNLLNAYNSISPGSLQGAAGLYGQQQQMYSAQAAQPNPFLSAAVNYASMGGFGGGGGGDDGGDDADAGFFGTKPGKFYR